MTLDYDSDGDVMYIVLEDSFSPCVYEENADGDVLRIERDTQKVVGITLPLFALRTQREGAIKVPGFGAVDVTAGMLETTKGDESVSCASARK